MRFNRRHYLLLFLLIAVVIVFIPFKVYYGFEATAVILPLKEWHLKHGQDDSYISELNDNSTNVISHLRSYKFERGDISEVHLREKLDTGSYIRENDTIAYIHSYYIENELTRLKSLKLVEENALKMSRSGEKKELIDQAEKKFEFAKQQLDLDQRKYIREKKLFEDSIISTADFEITENAYRLAQINVEIAENELKSLKSGVKPEEIEYIEQRIEGYSKEIEKLEKLASQYYITSPVNGIVSFNKGANGVLTISDTSNYVLKIPVKINNLKYLQKITAIKFSIPGYDKKINASFLNLEENVNIWSNEQMVLAKAIIPGGKYRLLPGMMVQCRVICDKVTLLQYIKRGMQLKI